MKHTRSVAFIGAGIFLLIYGDVYSFFTPLEFLSFYVSPLFCIIGFILAMTKE